MYNRNFKCIKIKINNNGRSFCLFPLSAYGYGTLANLLCCLCSLAGAFIIPFAKRHKTAYNVVLSVFMGLAVGALASDAILHLVPEVSSGPPAFVLLSFTKIRSLRTKKFVQDNILILNNLTFCKEHFNGVFVLGGGGMTFHKHVYVYGKIISRNFNDYYNTGNYSTKKKPL